MKRIKIYMNRLLWLLTFIVTCCFILNGQQKLSTSFIPSFIENYSTTVKVGKNGKSLLPENQYKSSLMNDSQALLKTEEMMIRIAVIEIVPSYQDEYIAILKEEAAASVRKESGVLCIFPMYEKENPLQIKLLEIYRNKEAYESHLKTSHFLHYKTTTLPMVKSLELIDMEAIDPETMVEIFKKIK